MRNGYESAGARRARAKGLFVEHVKRSKLLARHDGLCGICHRKVNPRNFTVDHIIPLSRGGKHAYWNCQPAHSFCNMLKADRMPDDLDDILPVIWARQKKLSYRNNGLVHKKSRKSRPSYRSR